MINKRIFFKKINFIRVLLLIVLFLLFLLFFFVIVICSIRNIFTRSCEICCWSKVSKHKPYGLLNPLDIPNRPWTSISMNFITDLPKSNGYTFILVVIDSLSKMCHLIPFPNIPSATDTISAFLNQIFRYHGFPTEILSDRGTQFG